MSNKLKPGQKLFPGDQLYSLSGEFELIYQHDGNLCIYKRNSFRIREPGCVWTVGEIETPGYAIMQADGNFALWASDGKYYYATDTYIQEPDTASNVGYLIMQDDGNLVIYHSDGEQVWASGSVQH